MTATAPRAPHEPAAAQPEPAAVLGVATAPKDPAALSARLAADAVRQVHDLPEVAPEAPLAPHADPKVPGANFVERPDDPAHPRWWVGMAGEVEATSTDDPRLGREPRYARARARYTAAVEAVRLHCRVPTTQQLFAVPDTYVRGAFFVHDGTPAPLVRWVDADGGAHDGYRLVDGSPCWDAATVVARRAALAAQPGTADLVG